MNARVRFADGKVLWRRITNIENDGSGEYGYVMVKGQKVAVSQTTTIKYASGKVEKQWDEVIQGSPAFLPLEEEW